MYIVKLVEHRVRVFLWSTYQYVPVAVLAEPVDDQSAGHKVPWPPAHKVPCYSTCARWVGGGSTGSHTVLPVAIQTYRYSIVPVPIIVPVLVQYRYSTCTDSAYSSTGSHTVALCYGDSTLLWTKVP